MKKKKEKMYAARITSNCGIQGVLQYVSNSIGERENKIRIAYKDWPLQEARKDFDNRFERVTLTIKVEK